MVYTRSKSYNLPSHLKSHVATVFYTDEIPTIITKHSKLIPNYDKISPNLDINLVTSAPTHTTVNYLNSFYQIPSNNGDVNMSQGVFETQNEYFSTADLTEFQQLSGVAVQAARVIGDYETKSCGTKSCTEGNLDIQVSVFTSITYLLIGILLILFLL